MLCCVSLSPNASHFWRKSLSLTVSCPLTTGTFSYLLSLGPFYMWMDEILQEWVRLAVLLMFPAILLCWSDFMSWWQDHSLMKYLLGSQFQGIQEIIQLVFLGLWWLWPSNRRLRNAAYNMADGKQREGKGPETRYILQLCPSNLIYPLRLHLWAFHLSMNQSIKEVITCLTLSLSMTWSSNWELNLHWVHEPFGGTVHIQIITGKDSRVS